MFSVFFAGFDSCSHTTAVLGIPNSLHSRTWYRVGTEKVWSGYGHDIAEKSPEYLQTQYGKS